jgi:hypothetical protein
MLFRETVAVFCVNHTKSINILRRAQAEILNVKASGIHSNHSAFRG